LPFVLPSSAFHRSFREPENQRTREPENQRADVSDSRLRRRARFHRFAGYRPSVRSTETTESEGIGKPRKGRVSASPGSSEAGGGARPRGRRRKNGKQRPGAGARSRAANPAPCGSVEISHPTGRCSLSQSMDAALRQKVPDSHQKCVLMDTYNRVSCVSPTTLPSTLYQRPVSAESGERQSG